MCTVGDGVLELPEALDEKRAATELYDELGILDDEPELLDGALDGELEVVVKGHHVV